MSSDSAPSQNAGQQSGDDEAAVRALYDQLMQGWNAGSGERFAAPFTADGHLVAFDGIHFQGREQIARFHQQLFDKWMSGTRLVGGVEQVRFLSPDVALIHAVGNTVARGKTKPDRERASIQTLVAVREDGEWRLAAFQNTRIRPIGKSGFTFLLWTIFDRLWRLFRLSTDPDPGALPEPGHKERARSTSGR
ncbi:MAG TPA: SgcJ/EcaC family oxidoreductase [Acidimicrobiales bacterium]